MVRTVVSWGRRRHRHGRAVRHKPEPRKTCCVPVLWAASSSMRFKLLRRRLTISAPRMKVRSAMPWPLQWAGAAIVLGFCGAIALWTFELGKGLAGVDNSDKEELAQLRETAAKLRGERDRLQSIMNTSGSAMLVERSAQERLSNQIRVLELENR